MRGPCFLATVTLVLSGGALQAQQTCDLSTPPTAVAVIVNAETPNEIRYIGGGVRLDCQAGTSIRSDSVMITRAGGFADFVGNVTFADTAKTLTAATARYYSRDRHLAAQGGSGQVVLTDLRTGSVIRGPTLDYFQDGERIEIYSGRPVATFFRTSPDQRQPGDTTEVVADQMTIIGQNVFRGVGNVVVQRADVRATARDRAFFDEEGGILRLVGQARMEGEYTLVGEDSILAYTERAPARPDLARQGAAGGQRLGQLRAVPPDTGGVADTLVSVELDPTPDDPDAPPADPDDFREILAFGAATLESDDMSADGQRIRLHFAGGEVERLVVLGQGAPEEGGDVVPGPAETARQRAVVRSETILMEADSIDAHAPGRVIDEVAAVGAARGVMRDTAGADLEGVPEIARDSWIEGDTIRAFFAAADTVDVVDQVREPDRDAVRDEAGAPAGDRVLERLVALGGPASSLFRQRAADDAAGAWDVSYLLAQRIEVLLENGAVLGVQAEGDVKGIQLTPDGTVRSAGGGSP
jgi:hypothetical protein